MSQPLDPLRGLFSAAPSSGVQSAAAHGAGKTADGKSFSDVLGDFVQQVDQAQHQFDDAISAVERGAADNLHQVMLAQNQAQLSLKLAAEVRNKLVEAYREVMRTQF